jgi:hypothetical protein
MRLADNAGSLLVALALAASPLYAQQQSGTQPVPTLHSTARVVVLDVVVSDGKGNPAKGLTQSDFTLYEDGVPQTLYRIHYRIDPSQLRLLATADGSYADDLRFVTVVYRDDGVEANSLNSPGHIAFSAADYSRVMKSPFGFDQIVAVPAGSAFDLRSGVQELSSNRIGAVELPIADIKLPAAQPVEAEKP